MAQNRILALDISGTATGWCYLVNSNLESFGKYIAKPTAPKGKKLLDFYVWVEDMLNSKKPDIVLIEKPYRGRNSNVLVNISKFIAVVELLAIKVLGLEIDSSWFVDPKKIKTTLQVKKGRDYYDNKRLMVNKINSLYGLKLKFKAKKAKAYNDDDISDSIALAHAWLVLNK